MLISSQQGINIVIGRGSTLADVLLAANAKISNQEQLFSQSEIKLDKLPLDYQFNVSVNNAVELTTERAAFIQHRNGKINGIAWFAGVLYNNTKQIY